MTQLSSNATLFFKFFLPIFWIVFLGATTFAVWNAENMQLLSFNAKLIITGLYILGIVILSSTIMRLKRVEIDQDYLYITNYFQHIRYQHQDIEKIITPKKGFFPFGKIVLKAPGRFGQTIRYIPMANSIREFIEKEPENAFPVEWK